MRNKIKLPKATLTIAIYIFTLLSLFSKDPVHAASNKIDLEVGGYSLVANSGTTRGNISSLGIYRVGYRRSVTPRLDLGIGYTVLFTKIVTGDTGFGLDLNGTYYFLGASSQVEAKGEKSYLTYSEDIRPSFTLSFSQRNYQSIQTSYAGFGAGVAVEKTLVERLSAKVSTKYNMLSAGQGATAKELSFYGGLVIEF